MGELEEEQAGDQPAVCALELVPSGMHPMPTVVPVDGNCERRACVGSLPLATRADGTHGLRCAIAARSSYARRDTQRLCVRALVRARTRSLMIEGRSVVRSARGSLEDNQANASARRAAMQARRFVVPNRTRGFILGNVALGKRSRLLWCGVVVAALSACGSDPAAGGGGAAGTGSDDPSMNGNAGTSSPNDPQQPMAGASPST